MLKRNLVRSGQVLTIILIAIYIFAQSNSLNENASSTIWQGHEKAVTSVVFSPSGKWVVSGSLDGTVRIWDVKSGVVKSVIRAHTGEVYSVSISVDERFIASASFDQRVLISNLIDGKTAQIFSDFNGWCQNVVFSPDGKQIAVSTTDGRITVWNIENGKKTQSITAPSWQMALAWSPDGKYLASSLGSVTIWDVTTGQIVKTLRGHTYNISSLSYSPNGKFLASASLDKTVKIWNTESGEVLQTLEPGDFMRMVRGKLVNDEIKVPVMAVVFSPDGKRVATAGADRLVTIWDVETGKIIEKMQGHIMTITDVDFSPDGKKVVSASLDQTIRIWDLK